MPQSPVPHAKSSRASGNGRSPRRLDRTARREQLVKAAVPVIAEQGFSKFSLDEVAEAADVSRNLLYHYFPRGRPDVALAVVESVGHELTDNWVTAEEIPLEERLAVNNMRMIEHATKPSDAWLIYQLARSVADDEIREAVDRFTDVVVRGMSLNHLGTEDPPPSARLALFGYLAFFGAAMEEARSADVPLDRVLGILARTLVAALDAASE